MCKWISKFQLICLFKQSSSRNYFWCLILDKLPKGWLKVLYKSVKTTIFFPLIKASFLCPLIIINKISWYDRLHDMLICYTKTYFTILYLERHEHQICLASHLCQHLQIYVIWCSSSDILILEYYKEMLFSQYNLV